jgi:hypothetical protein
MADRPSIRENLAGAWMVMNGNPAGLARLDVSVNGFWRSFAAIFLLAPYLVLGFIDQTKLQESSDPALAATASDNVGLQLVATGVDWLVFPLVFALLARPLGVADRYVPFIVARNWAAVIASTFFAVVTVAHLFGLASDAALPYLLIIVLGVTLRFSYLLIRATLGVPVAVAVPIVFLDILLSLVVQVGFARLM